MPYTVVECVLWYFSLVTLCTNPITLLWLPINLYLILSYLILSMVSTDGQSQNNTGVFIWRDLNHSIHSVLKVWHNRIKLILKKKSLKRTTSQLYADDSWQKWPNLYIPTVSSGRLFSWHMWPLSIQHFLQAVFWPSPTCLVFQISGIYSPISCVNPKPWDWFNQSWG